MDTIDIASLTLPDLIALIDAGKDLKLTRDGQVIAQVTSWVRDPSKRKFGAWRGIVSVGPEFFDPLPEEELAAFE